MRRSKWKSLWLAGVLALAWPGHLAHGHGSVPPPTPEEEAALSALGEGTPVADLLRQVSSGRYHLALKAGELLRARRDATALPELLETAARPPTLENRFAVFAALVALSGMDEPRAREAVLKHAPEAGQNFLVEMIPLARDQALLAELRESYRQAATRGLSPREQAEALAARLEDAGEWVREALVALGEDAVPALAGRAGDPGVSAPVRVQALRCLAELKGGAALPLLIRIVQAQPGDALLGGSDQVLGEAAAALVASSPAEGLKAVQACFERHRGWLARLHVVRCLGEVPDPAVQLWLEEIASRPEATSDTAATRDPEGKAQAVRDHAALAAARIEARRSEDPSAARIGLLAHPHAWVRAFAIQGLGTARDARALEHAVRALEDPDDNVRRFAIELLGALGDRRAVEPLEAVLEGHRVGDQLHARLALEALGQRVIFSNGVYRSLDPEDPLVPILRQPAGTPGESARLLEALLDRGADGGRVLGAALQSPDPAIQASGQAYLEALSARLNDGDEALSARAIRVLQGAGTWAVPTLLQAVRGLANPRLRGQAAEALGLLGRQAAPALAAALESDPPPPEACLPDLFHAFVLSGPEADLLRSQVEHEQPLRRRLAFRALAQSETPETLARTVRGLADRDASVRREAFQILAGWRGPEVVPALDALAHSDAEARSRAAAAHLLARRCPTAGLAEIASHLAVQHQGENDPQARSDAIATLRLLRLPECVFPLLECTRDIEASHALEADAALTSLDGEILMQALQQAGVSALADARASADVRVRALSALFPYESVEERTSAAGRWIEWSPECPYPTMPAHALGHAGGDRAAAWLVQQLGHRSPAVRRAAAHALGETGVTEGLQALEGLLHDPEPTVSFTARRAIARLRGREP
ncbi:MAG: HEAT repeat domain-containing protein [Planctomycetes bacterium]|nr:HEAT repeat domain-containing protein [Planctomycetota bacterium]